MNLMMVLATIIASAAPAFAQNSQSIEFKEITGKEKLYFSVHAPNISNDNTYEVEVIVDQPGSYSITYDPFNRQEFEGYLSADNTPLISAQQIKQLIIDNPSDYDNDDLRQKGLICGNVKVRINTISSFLIFESFDTIMNMNSFLICHNAKNKKMYIGNKQALTKYKHNGIEVNLQFKQ